MEEVKTTKKTAETAEKPKRKNKTPRVKKPDEVKTENVNIDINSFDWGEDCKLTEKQKLFVIWYTHPAMKHNATQAAIKAGYSVKNADNYNIRLRNNPEILSFIKKFEQKYLKQSLDDFYFEAVQSKIRRANFDVSDFYEKKTYYDQDGNERQYISIKDPAELSPEQRKCIDEIKINNNGMPSYIFADRTHETEFLMKLKEKLDGDGKDDNSFQVETTAEIIKGNLQLKTKVIQANAEIAESSDLNNKTAERTEED